MVTWCVAPKLAGPESKQTRTEQHFPEKTVGRVMCDLDWLCIYSNHS